MKIWLSRLILSLAFLLSFQSTQPAAVAVERIKAKDLCFDNSCIPTIITNINETQPGDSIIFHQFVFSDQNFVKPLIAAHERGVTVKIVISPNLQHYGKKRVHDKLTEAGIPVVLKHTHEKTIYITHDKGKKEITWIGSRNLSQKAYSQEEVLQRVTGNAAGEMEQIWQNIEKGAQVQILSPVKKLSSKKEKIINTPQKTKVFSARIISPNKVMVATLRNIKNTPDKIKKQGGVVSKQEKVTHKKRKRTIKKGKQTRSKRQKNVAPEKREVHVAVMNINARARDGKKRISLLKEIYKTATAHPTTNFKVLLDTLAQDKKSLQGDLKAINELENVIVEFYNPAKKEVLGKKRPIMHLKLLVIKDPYGDKENDRSILLNSTGNPTVEGGNEPNMTIIGPTSAPDAQEIIDRIRAIPSTPFGKVTP